MGGDIYKRTLPELQKNICDILHLEPGDIGLARLNKDQLIELLFAIKKLAKT